MKRKPNAPDAPLDRGYMFWPRCTTCVFARCIKELAPPERAEFADAWRIVTAHMAPARP